jgi:hypothetical protein
VVDARIHVVYIAGPFVCFIKRGVLFPVRQVGVQLDEPSGSNDGTIKGARKFTCPDKYGAFVRGANVAVGDYPERDLFGSDDEEGDGDHGGKEGGCGHDHDHSGEQEEEDQDEF